MIVDVILEPEFVPGVWSGNPIEAVGGDGISARSENVRGRPDRTVGVSWIQIPNNQAGVRRTERKRECAKRCLNATMNAHS